MQAPSPIQRSESGAPVPHITGNQPITLPSKVSFCGRIWCCFSCSSCKKLCERISCCFSCCRSKKMKNIDDSLIERPKTPVISPVTDSPNALRLRHINKTFGNQEEEDIQTKDANKRPITPPTPTTPPTPKSNDDDESDTVAPSASSISEHTSNEANKVYEQLVPENKATPEDIKQDDVKQFPIQDDYFSITPITPPSSKKKIIKKKKVHFPKEPTNPATEILNGMQLRNGKRVQYIKQ